MESWNSPDTEAHILLPHCSSAAESGHPLNDPACTRGHRRLPLLPRAAAKDQTQLSGNADLLQPTSCATSIRRYCLSKTKTCENA